MLVFLSLGSNLGNTDLNLDLAIRYISDRKLLNAIECSSRINTKAILPEAAPESWNIDYKNQVIFGDTKLSPNLLLKEIKQIEKTLGRVKRQKWAPREIDIDILIFGDMFLDSDILHIPHRELLNRQFLVDLIKEIDPNFVMQPSLAGVQ